jgi:hypothetical protein
MMKLILSVCGLLALTIAQAETNVGIVYGHDGDTTTNHGTNTLYTIWAAGTEAGPFLGYFDYSGKWPTCGLKGSSTETPAEAAALSRGFA